MAENDDKKPRQIKFWRTIKNRLYARLQYQDETGKWREKLKPITDKRTARSAVEEMRRELETHGEETLRSDKITFAQLAEKYLKAKVFPAVIRDGMKVSGLKSSRSVEMHVKTATKYFGKKLLRSFKPSDIEKFKDFRLNTAVKKEVWQEFPQLDENEKPITGEDGKPQTFKKKVWRETPRKIASVNRELATVRAMFNFALEERLILRSPVPKNILSTSAEVERDRILSHAEETALLSVCTDERSHIKPILICALDTAMRPEEIFKLQWRDVDFNTLTITVRAENAKTEKPRLIFIGQRLKNELEKLWKISPQNLNLSVFGTKSIKSAFRTACKKAGIENFRFRDCRHTATTRMVLAGYSHAEVMKITGHTQTKTFLRYLNLTPEAMQNKSSLLDTYLVEKEVIQESDSVN